MAQFTAYYNERGGEDAIPYLLDVQSDWVETGSRVVVPLVRRLRYGPLYSRLNPVFTISDTEVVMAPSDLAAIDAQELRRPVADLHAGRSVIMMALDFLLLGS